MTRASNDALPIGPIYLTTHKHRLSMKIMSVYGSYHIKMAITSNYQTMSMGCKVDGKGLASFTYHLPLAGVSINCLCFSSPRSVKRKAKRPKRMSAPLRNSSLLLELTELEASAPPKWSSKWSRKVTFLTQRRRSVLTSAPPFF